MIDDEHEDVNFYGIIILFTFFIVVALVGWLLCRMNIS